MCVCMCVMDERDGRGQEVGRVGGKRRERINEEGKGGEKRRGLKEGRRD